jgi:hypothetical protein
MIGIGKDEELYWVVLGLEGEPLYAKPADSKELGRNRPASEYSWAGFCYGKDADSAVEFGHARAVKELFDDTPSLYTVVLGEDGEPLNIRDGRLQLFANKLNGEVYRTHIDAFSQDEAIVKAHAQAMQELFA